MIAKLLTSVLVLVMGILMAWVYLRGTTGEPSSHHPLSGSRPWRKVGAGICLLIAVMFVVGIYVVDIPERPIPYALYWIVMLGLVIWLIVLAVRDFMYTRSLIRRWREDQRRQGAQESSGMQALGRESIEP